MNKVWLYIISVLLAVSLLVTGSAAEMGTSQNSNECSREIEENIKTSNEMVFRFWDYYTDYDTEIYLPPDSFGGFHLNQDGSLSAYITEETETARMSIIKACRSDDLQFVVVKHSFNELYNALLDISQYAKEENINCRLTLNLEENAVVILVEDEDSVLSVNNKLNGLNIKVNATIRVDVQQIATAEVRKTDVNTEYANITSNRDTTDFYPGQMTTFIDDAGITNHGTVGFCATDSLGRKVLITHAHHYDFPESNGNILPSTTTVGDLTMGIYTLSNVAKAVNDDEHDAAVISIPYLYPCSLTGQINNDPNYSITSVTYDCQLQSYESPNSASCVVFQRNGYNGPCFTSESVNLVCNPDSGVWSIQMCALQPNPGDSGGPILMPGTTQNRLVGTIKDQHGKGITWQAIRDRYYEKTGYTLTVFTSPYPST